MHLDGWSSVPEHTRTPDALGPQMRIVKAALAQHTRALELIDSACTYDPRTRKFTFRAEFFTTEQPETGRKIF